ncbi:universal stress protein UspA-like protein [Desulfosporosinus acidiphilus SJ4]|uniref:Universal stress protein UspA-like protein n=1 Tax=Desulfosporosinus acidiphilus (strain DSM 22704 / JCM 16185 / SJ4) TaxID=646529 RepID=I4D654_DESAJ|nr:universal stress protein [Desulfosporosinus acidiphilus]AFM41278.1 universal stress protein UspA-like protein [Desulfosporosinus acidiphilus SJ4]
MTNVNFNVLLYSDGSTQTFNAAVYTANLFNDIPNMKLTVLQIQESHERFMGTEFSWAELRRKYKRMYWENESDLSWSQTYLKPPKDEWFKRIFTMDDDPSEHDARLVSKTNRIFVENSSNINHQILFTNINKADISDTADLILDYSRRNPFNLIILGADGLSMFKGLIFGDLAHKVQVKSPIPVLMIKKLSQKFINNYLSDAKETVTSQMPHIISGHASSIFF